MRLSKVISDLQKQGLLDQRALLSYATLTGTVHGASFQNLVAAAFQTDRLLLFRAELDGSVGKLLLDIPYTQIQDFELRHRFLYSYTSFAAAGDQLRFYHYDKQVFLRGFRDAGMLQE